MTVMYRDKNNRIIKAGMRLKHNGGIVERVYQGDTVIGFNATNRNYNQDIPEQIYPLSEFNLKEWEIIAYEW